jgi:lantibiotic modifying enzyme
MEAADLHNFGQAVQKIGRGSEKVFQKPRPIYWEWLFFGQNSPLSIFFEQSRVQGVNPRQVLFNLTTEINANYCGVSSEIIGQLGTKTLSSHAYSLGVLLAYCYIFGIRDLHRHNLVKTQAHLQVVDAEVVFF